MKINCETAEGLIAELLGEEIDAMDRARLDQHLSDCVDCRREVASLSRVQSTLIDGLEPRASFASARSSDTSNTHRATGKRNGMPMVRLAAMIAISFGLGYIVRGMPETGTSNDGPRGNGPNERSAVVRTGQRGDGLRAEFAARLKAAHRLTPGASDFSKSLMALLGNDREG